MSIVSGYFMHNTHNYYFWKLEMDITLKQSRLKHECGK